MEIVLLYIIPLIVSGVFHYFYRMKISLLETIAMFLAPTIVIGCVHLIMYYTSINDKTNENMLVNRVEYYEPYNTYVFKMCQSCTTNSKGQQTCYSYDCSYCDYNSEKYKMIFENGDSRSVNKKFYDSIIREFEPNKAKFVDLHRNISYSLTCGKDGDKYVTYWNGKIEKSITDKNVFSFENPILINKNAYNFKEYSDDELNNKQLLNSIDYINSYSHNTHLLNFPKEKIELFKRYLDYVNTVLQKNKKGQIYFIFTNKPISHAIEQKSVMLSGKNNQMIVIIGISENNKINYVYPFSWSKNKRIEVDIKRDIEKLDVINNPNELVQITKYRMDKFEIRDMKDFDYLSHSLSTPKLITLYALMIIISVVLSIYFVNNEYDYDN